MYLFPDNVKENVQKANITSTTARRWKFYYGFLNNGPDEKKKKTQQDDLKFLWLKILGFLEQSSKRKIIVLNLQPGGCVIPFAHLHTQELHPGFPLLCRQRPLAPLWPQFQCGGTWVCRWRTVRGMVRGTTSERHLSQVSSPLSSEIQTLSK